MQKNTGVIMYFYHREHTVRQALAIIMGLTIVLSCLISERRVLAADETNAVTDIKASHRSGYTFITFKEISRKDAHYRVYRSSKLLSAETLTESNCIAILHQDSARIRDIHEHPKKDSDVERRIFIQDVDKGGQEIPSGTGVLIWTCQADETVYYAVTSLVDNVENKKLIAKENVIAEPVNEKKPVAPLAIKARNYDQKEKAYGSVFLFPMNYRLWNPDKIDDNPIGYVRIVNITIPEDANKRKDPLPVVYILNGFTAWIETFSWAFSYSKNAPVIQVGVLCNYGDWYFGYADTITSANKAPKNPPPSNAVVYPYTEWLLLKTREWLLSNPENLPAKADIKRFYSFGTSQGGTGGCLIIARHGDKFAAAMCSKSITRWDDQEAWSAAYGGGGGWGKQFPLLIGKCADNLKLPSGERVYDVLNVAKMLREHPEYDAPFMVLGQGVPDIVIPWKPFPDYIRALEMGKHPFAAAWRPHGHSGALMAGTHMAKEGDGPPPDRPQLAFANCPHNDDLGQGRRSAGLADPKDMTQNSIKSQRIDGVVPQFPKEFVGADAYVLAFPGEKPIALGKISKVEGDVFWVEQNPLEAIKQFKLVSGKAMWLIADVKLSGEYNSFFEWHINETHKIPGARPTIDEADRLEIQVRLAGAAATFEETTADVTPRRCQKFKPASGSQVKYKILDCRVAKTESVLKEGTVVVDKNGLVTIPSMPIYKAGAGVRLVLFSATKTQSFTNK